MKKNWRILTVLMILFSCQTQEQDNKLVFREGATKVKGYIDTVSLLMNNMKLYSYYFRDSYLYINDYRVLNKKFVKVSEVEYYKDSHPYNDTTKFLEYVFNLSLNGIDGAMRGQTGSYIGFNRDKYWNGEFRSIRDIVSISRDYYDRYLSATFDIVDSNSGLYILKYNDSTIHRR